MRKGITRESKRVRNSKKKETHLTNKYRNEIKSRIQWSKDDGKEYRYDDGNDDENDEE